MYRPTVANHRLMRQLSLQRAPSVLSVTLLVCALGAGCGVAPLPSTGGQATEPKVVDGTDVATDANDRPAADANVPTTAAPSPGSVAVDANARAGSAASLPDGAVHADGPLVAAGTPGYYALALKGCTGAVYHVRLNIGANSFNVVADSGSSSAAVGASNCATCGSASRYNTATGTNLNRQASASYGSGSWTGAAYSDAMGLGGGSAKTPAYPVKFGVMTKQAGILQPYSCREGRIEQRDGILGLGPNTLLSANTTSLLAQLTGSKSLVNDVFAVKGCGVDGNLLLGGYDATHVRSQPFFVPLVTDRNDQGSFYYAVTLAGMNLGGNVVAQANTLGSVIVDNGTSLLYVSDAAYKGFRAALAADANFTDNFSIDTLEVGYMGSKRGLSREQLDAILPKFGLVFVQAGGNKATLWLDATSSYLLPLLDSGGGTQYILTVHAGESTGLPLLMGNAMMRQHLVIFDRAGKRIGFAPQRGCDAEVAYAGG